MKKINHEVEGGRASTVGVKSLGILMLLLMMTALAAASAISQKDKKSTDADMMAFHTSVRDDIVGRRINVTLKDTPIAEALHIIARKARLGISFDPEDLPRRKVSLEGKKMQVEAAFKKVLEGTQLEASLFQDRKIIIIQKKVLAVVAETITGVVIDAATNEPLPGVNILVKGTTTGTNTDVNGEFELTVPSLQDTLRFSYIGFETQTVPINGRSALNIQLKPQTLSGEELVVVGYGSQEAEDITGSVSSVKSAELMERPSINVEQTLSGKVAGVNVSTNSGRPGGAHASVFVATAQSTHPMIRCTWWMALYLIRASIRSTRIILNLSKC